MRAMFACLNLRSRTASVPSVIQNIFRVQVLCGSISMQEELYMSKIMAVGTLFFLALLAEAASAQDYTVIDLGTLGGQVKQRFCH